MISRKRDKTSPFLEGSMLHRVWTMALRETSLRELTSLCKKENTNLTWLLRVMRKGVRPGWTWSVLEANGKFKIYNAKRL